MTNTSFVHKDILDSLNHNLTLKEKLVCTHEAIKQFFPFLARIAITIYDPATTLLKSYLDSGDDSTSWQHCEVHLEELPSLKKVLEKGNPRVINNMVTFEDNEFGHLKRLGREGFAASYTMPFFDNGVFSGFIFFNSQKADIFTDDVLHKLDIVGHMVSLLVINEMEAAHALTAAVKTSEHFTHVRDTETGSHLNRMSRYSRLIAICLAHKYNLDDSYIEHILSFSTLHDIGKVGIPDSILQKPGKLTLEEMEIMRTHARRGREIIDDLISNFGLGHFDHVSVLRNIAEYHHEAINGTGYPEGKKGTDIPLEARIVAVADVFDALTSDRAYKKAWSNDEAFAILKEMSGERLDRDCVDAIIFNRMEVEEIQQQFKEDKFG
ncbi:metal dependent phosphohydrolase [Candidatus Scalindua japonica]|uniref:Metal dependent phosphohydrolase n=1 Tax=Candidatus Scalindua japonica TaxID=1284222 RepID=A0A286TY64_9BACT|nr:HD domain-containing phosphohydrolase [Candidatus Scalindua japonica]GAX60810.1 metal dependent phosphohydrolase [Candidatus Scalindua japonica]